MSRKINFSLCFKVSRIHIKIFGRRNAEHRGIHVRIPSPLKASLYYFTTTGKYDSCGRSFRGGFYMAAHEHTRCRAAIDPTLILESLMKTTIAVWNRTEQTPTHMVAGTAGSFKRSKQEEKKIEIRSPRVSLSVAKLGLSDQA